MGHPTQQRWVSSKFIWLVSWWHSGHHGSAPDVDSVTEPYFRVHPSINVYASAKRQTMLLSHQYHTHFRILYLEMSSAKHILLVFLSFHLRIKSTLHMLYWIKGHSHTRTKSHKQIWRTSIFKHIEQVQNSYKKNHTIL